MKKIFMMMLLVLGAHAQDVQCADNEVYNHDTKQCETLNDEDFKVNPEWKEFF